MREGALEIATKNSSLKECTWESWFKHKDKEAGNELIQHYMYLITYHVDRISYTLPSVVSKDDLKSYALMGLLDALHKFEPERNLKFDTYASFRIRGSIIDGLRKEDWLPRTLREKAKQIEHVSELLEKKLQRPPTSSEIAEELELTQDEVESIIQDSLFANVLSIEQKPSGDNSDHKEGIGYLVPDEDAIVPDNQLVKNELAKDIAQSIKKLNENEQLIISLFYEKELTMTEIGDVLGLTTSRISQIHKRAIFKLRESLKKINRI